VGSQAAAAQCNHVNSVKHMDDMDLSKIQSDYDSICVIVDRLSKVVYFIAVKTIYKDSKLVKLYIARIVCLHEVSKKIVSD
jgi:hypothetical protein